MAYLAPASDSAIDAIAAVLASLPRRAESQNDAKIVLRLFVEDLGDLPRFAIEAACKDFRTGRAGDGHWAPSAAEIRTQAERLARSYRDELASITEILGFADRPQEPSAVNRASIATRFAGLRAELANNVDPFAAPKIKLLSDITPSEAQANLDRMAAEGRMRRRSVASSVRSSRMQRVLSKLTKTSGNV